MEDRDPLSPLGDVRTAPPTPELGRVEATSRARRAAAPVARERAEGLDGDPDLVSFAKQLAKRKVSVQGNRSVFKWSFRSKPQQKYASDCENDGASQSGCDKSHPKAR
ncbi:unnamed protein product [Effrenium voratum]|nr:unnamed protein product [Effrenium voratum]